ncbi:MAG: pseudaminic acid cytidylyltransferase [Burkholderiales bacterium]|nr:pseudaminic acid cytidylyltransferase [Burkholderiales bacterium]
MSVAATQGECVAIIPARGGSKRVPRKNLRRFEGVPMIQRTVGLARDSGVFDRIVVSTDDQDVASLAREAGASTPFVRPPELSDDRTPIDAVVRHAITELRAEGASPDIVCCLYATAVLLTPADLRRGRDMLFTSGRSFAIGVCAYAHPVQRALWVDQDGAITMREPEHRGTRTQDLRAAYHDAGQFCWGQAAAFMAGTPTLSTASVAVVLPRERVVDIDTPEDWVVAEALHRALHGAPCASFAER